MTTTAERKYTEAETALIKAFSAIENASSHHAGDGWRNAAIEQFKELGLPSRKLESWHYTDLRTLLKTVPTIAQDTPQILEALIDGSMILPSSNGKTAMVVKPSDAVKVSILKEHFSGQQNPLANDDTIGQLNTAFAHDGWHIEVPENTQYDQVIELQNQQNQGQGHLHHEINIGANSSLIVVERQSGDNHESLVSSLSHVTLQKGANVTWLILREQGEKAIEFNQFNAVLGEDAKLTLYIVNAGAALIRQEIKVTLEGRESDFQLRGVNLLSAKSHSDVTMVVRHLDEASTSTEIIRNVVTDQARGAFQGMIRVAQQAQKTDARMACNSLILSDDAEFDAKPELEIFADDVACGHGATVTEIDHDHLFYLMARGIPEAEARGLLIKAFVSELVDEIDHEQLQETLVFAIEKWLQKHI